MKARMSCSGVLFALLFMVGVIAVQAQSANPQEILNQYISDLQKNPDDTALREKIIALALTMNPPPEVPAEAKRHMSRGVAAVEDAKTSDDFKDACDEFRQATTLAPWLANGYRNLAIAQDKARMYNESLASLRLYFLTKPSPSDVDWAEALKSKVEYRKEKAGKEAEAKAKESRPEAIAARKQSTFDTFLAGLDGRRYVSIYKAPAGITIDIRGRVFVFGLVNVTDSMGFHPGYRQGGFPGPNPTAIQGMETVVQINSEILVSATFIISADGSSITRHTTRRELPPIDEVFVWQR
jgi:hypothetical protein